MFGHIRHLTIANNARRGALVAGAAAVLLLGVACTPTTEVTVAGSAETSQGIAVSGQGSASVTPDLAVLNLGVEVNAETVADARGQAADAMQAIEDAVTELGVEARDIQTQYFNIYPQYSYEEGRAPTITGFVVANQAQVKVRNLDSVSDVLDAAIEAGGDVVRVNGISFTVEDPEQHLADARREAVANARAHAEILADAAGVELGAAISINESVNNSQPPSPSFAGREQDASGGSTPVSPGEQELTVYVSVVYGIEE